MIDLLAQFGSAGTLAVGSLGLYVALRNQHRQLNAQMLIEFSKRFQEMLRTFPKEAWLANRDPSMAMPPSSQELADCTRYAMQLIADVYHLRNIGYISKKIWDVWERQIRQTLAGPVFQREWQGPSTEFAYSGEYVRYIDEVMRVEEPRKRVMAAANSAAQ